MGLWERFFGSETKSEANLDLLELETDFEELISTDVALVYKHSTACWASQMAIRQVERLSARNPDLAIGLIDVLSNRALSGGVESRFDIRHETPQAILFSKGTPVWNGSHSRVKEKLLQKELDLLKDI